MTGKMGNDFYDDIFFGCMKENGMNCFFLSFMRYGEDSRIYYEDGNVSFFGSS
jgi:hypothetical protein